MIACSAFSFAVSFAVLLVFSLCVTGGTVRMGRMWDSSLRHTSDWTTTKRRNAQALRSPNVEAVCMILFFFLFHLAFRPPCGLSLPLASLWPLASHPLPFSRRLFDSRSPRVFVLVSSFFAISLEIVAIAIVKFERITRSRSGRSSYARQSAHACAHAHIYALQSRAAHAFEIRARSLSTNLQLSV